MIQSRPSGPVSIGPKVSTLRLLANVDPDGRAESSCPGAVDAIVVALKSRTIPAREAVAQSLTALAWLKRAGCRQFYFKYCSTFDSTPKGNIGPVTDALMHALGADFTIACPAFPEAGRTIFRGYLFVGDVLLSESGMKDHPLTPMTDANLVLGRLGGNLIGGAMELDRAASERAIREHVAEPLGLSPVEAAEKRAGRNGDGGAFRALAQPLRGAN